ncbi:MAG: exonuclease SbcCD subunit D [Armatimonadetes bacterium]|nr:exonuclease SbcCD subunit D [Armatimonadota bacterium]
MVKILHTADIHLGVENYGRMDAQKGINTRVLDFLEAFDFLVDRAREVDLVVFAGDAYKNQDPTPTVQREFARRIKRMASEVPVFLLVGNHDVPSTQGKASSIDIFNTLEVPGITVARTPGAHTIGTRRGPVQVAAYPWFPKSRFAASEEFRGLSVQAFQDKMREAVVRQIEDLAAEIDPALPSVLATHFTVAGAVFGGYRRSVLLGQEMEIPLGVVANAAFDYVALGHIHKFQEINGGRRPPVVYSGSIERVDFGEEHEAKGFVIAELSKELTRFEFVKTPARPMITIDVDADTENPMETILEAVSRKTLDGGIVRLIYRIPADRAAEVRPGELRAALKDAFSIADLRRESPVAADRARNPYLTETVRPLEALKEYIKTRPDYQKRADEILAYAEPLIAEVLERQSI